MKKKKKKQNKDSLSRMIGKSKVIRKKTFTDFELKMFKIELDNLNHAIRKVEEKEEKYVNFEVLGKLHHFNTEDKSVESNIEYFKLLSQIFTGDPPRIDELKDRRDYLMRLIKEIEDKKKKKELENEKEI